MKKTSLIIGIAGLLFGTVAQAQEITRSNGSTGGCKPYIVETTCTLMAELIQGNPPGAIVVAVNNETEQANPNKSKGQDSFFSCSNGKTFVRVTIHEFYERSACENTSRKLDKKQCTY